MEYKIEAISQVWSSKGLTKKATAMANDLSLEGWRLTKMEKGWSGGLFATLYLVFERERR